MSEEALARCAISQQADPGRTCGRPDVGRSQWKGTEGGRVEREVNSGTMRLGGWRWGDGERQRTNSLAEGQGKGRDCELGFGPWVFAVDPGWRQPVGRWEGGSGA